MLAPTRQLVSELNARARAARLGNHTADSEVALRDGNHASVGDIILTRLNARTLRTSGTDWVKNGDRWTIADIHDGAVEARHVRSGLSVVLPAEYVALVRERSEIPAALDRVAGLLPSHTRDDVLVWRAANGVADDDHRLLGPRVKDAAAFAYGHRLQRQIDGCYPPSVRRWEARVVEVVGHHDEQTLYLAHYLDGLHRGGHNPAQLLARAARRGPLPDDHTTEALAYRVQRLVTRSRSVEDPMALREPTRQRPGIGI